MDARFDALLAGFARAGEPESADLVSSLRSLPGPASMPSPWETWTLIGLVRHRERQLWVADIIRSRQKRGREYFRTKASVDVLKDSRPLCPPSCRPRPTRLSAHRDTGFGRSLHVGYSWAGLRERVVTVAARASAVPPLLFAGQE
jgi:hypothetical protein